MISNNKISIVQYFTNLNFVEKLKVINEKSYTNIINNKNVSTFGMN